MDDMLVQTLKKARALKGFTLQHIADELGVSYPAVQQWESGRTRPSMGNLIRLQELLGADLLAGRIFDVGARQQDTGYVAEPNAVMEGPAVAPWSPPVRDIEELGLGVASIDDDESAFEFNGQVVDRVIRPPGLVNRQGVFALRVANLSMWPKFRDGERIYVDQKKPAIEDFVVIELKPYEEGRPGKAYVKMLVGRDSKKIRVQQFNPEGFLEFRLDEILRLFRVIPTEELWG